MATRGRKPVKGMTRHNSVAIGLRVTREQEQRLKRMAAQQHISVGELLRAFAELALRDPAGVSRGLLAVAHQDFGGPEVTVERIVVPDPAELERAGQRRLPGLT